MGLLESVKNFKGLSALSTTQIELLCAEIREKIIAVTLKNGGHLASSLGSVELTVALLRAFNPDKDKIIFDVGHQSYTYKILTDRLNSFETIRTKGGIAGFPRMDESRYDFFTTGHSSTSISAAMGYAKARDISSLNHDVVAVIGDGALLNGISFEALNCIESTDSKIIIVLNDNKMSINPRVGGVAGHLARLAVNPAYKKVKDFIKEQCRTMKRGESIESALGHIKSKLKSLLLPTNIFEEMDISYWGPFDGHNVQEMEEVFNLARDYDKSLIIHLITKKGKGCQAAEQHPAYFHGISPGSSLSAPQPSSPLASRSWSAVMADTLINIAANDPKLVVCTAAMADGTNLNKFAAHYRNRFFDVGISEEHLFIYAAGMAAGGMKPVVCIYSTFLQRAADMIVHDICIPNLPVLIGIDRAGFVGEDGETHNGLLDVSWLRAIPNIVIAAPRDAAELTFFVNEWVKNPFTFAVRYPRGTAPQSMSKSLPENAPAAWGRAELLRQGKETEILLIGIGSTVSLMLDVFDNLRTDKAEKTSVADLRFIKPIDFESIDNYLESAKIVIIAEEAYISGGIGEALASHCDVKGFSCKTICIGVPDRFVSHATRSEQWKECGLTMENIVRICDCNAT